MCGLVVEGPVGLRGRCRVLHPAEDEVGDGDLRVARVRIRRSDAPLEELQHLGRRSERTLAVALAARKNVVVDRDFVAARLAARDLDERSRDHRHEIRAVRHVLTIAEGSAAVFVATIDQLAVAEREHALGHHDRRRRRLLLVRVIEAGKPVTRVLVLALRPGMRDLLGVVRPRLDEEQPVARPHDAVSHGKRRCRSRGDRRLEFDLELPLPRRKLQLAVGLRFIRQPFDSQDLQLHGIERQPRHGLVERPHRHRAHAVERFVREVRRQMEIDVLDRDDLVGAILWTHAGQRERLMFVRLVGH